MKQKTLFGVGLAMLLFATGFIVYALNNPQNSFLWSNTITYTIYLIYVSIMAGCFVLSKFLQDNHTSTDC